MYVYLYIYIYGYMHTHTPIHTYICVRITYNILCVYTYIYIYIYAHVYTCITRRGYPNVGKSSFMNIVTQANCDVQPCPPDEVNCSERDKWGQH